MALNEMSPEEGERLARIEERALNLLADVGEIKSDVKDLLDAANRRTGGAAVWAKIGAAAIGLSLVFTWLYDHVLGQLLGKR